MTQYCSECGTPYSGRYEQTEHIPLWAHCHVCETKVRFVNKDAYEARHGSVPEP